MNQEVIDLMNQLTVEHEKVEKLQKEIKAHLRDFDKEHYKCFLLLGKVKKLREAIMNCDCTCGHWPGLEQALADTEEK